MHVKLVSISIPAVYLDRLIADPQTLLACKQFRLRSFRLERLPSVFQVRRPVHHQPGRVDIRQHICQLRLYHLKIGERFAERGSVLAISDSLVKRGSGDSRADSTDGYSPPIEHLLCILEALPLGPDQALFGSVGVLKDHLRCDRSSVAKLLDMLARLCELCIHEKRRGTFRSLGEEEVEITVATVSREHLCTINEPLPTFKTRGRLQVPRVGAGPWLCQGEAGELLAANHLGKIFLLLAGVTELAHTFATGAMDCE